MSVSQWLYLILLSVLWGGSFFFVGVAVHDVPTATLVLLRVGLAALTLLPVLWFAGLSLPRSPAAWMPFVVMAVLNNIIPFSMITLGQSQIASGVASILNATTPLWAVLIAHGFTTDDKLTANKLAGVVLGIGGVAVLMGPDAVFGHSSSVIGMACVVAGAISYGFASLWGRRLRQTPALTSATCQLLCASVILLPVALFVDRASMLVMPSLPIAGAVVGLAVLSTAAAYIVFFHIVAVSGPTNAMLVTLLIPVSAIYLGVVVLGETLSYRQFAGAGVIALALLIFDGRLLRAVGLSANEQT